MVIGKPRLEIGDLHGTGCALDVEEA